MLDRYTLLSVLIILNFRPIPLFSRVKVKCTVAASSPCNPIRISSGRLDSYKSLQPLTIIHRQSESIYYSTIYLQATLRSYGRRHCLPKRAPKLPPLKNVPIPVSNLSPAIANYLTSKILPGKSASFTLSDLPTSYSSIDSSTSQRLSGSCS